MYEGTSDNELGIRALPPADLARLRPYVVNLSQGSFSGDGQFASTPADVDAIFDVHLPRFVRAAQHRPVPLVVWAHGGLVSEESGLRIAQGQVDWWLRNGVYPVHFVWESGLLDALKQAVGRLGVGRRDLWDHTTDPLLEEAVRPIGRRAWAAMKYSAQRASGEGGGGSYFVRKLSAFCAANADAVALHAVGHSAGSIFHAHLLAAAQREGVPPFESLQYLAPAIRADEFKVLVAPAVGSYVQALATYTMRRELERADSCLGAYRKSLLYLVTRALETERNTPVLGLEDTIVGDPDLAAFFGMRGAQGRAEVVWSTTDRSAPIGSRSESTSHGGFDNDPATMQSVATRILGGRKAQPFPAAAAAQARSLYHDVVGAAGGPAAAASGPASGADPDRVPRRLALCVGVDDYPAPNALAGCKADAQAWSAVLASMGFAVTELLDAHATRQGILDALETMVASARDGDVLVFQFSGHGTEVPDLDGDETAGTNGDRDEALCPVDFADGQLIVDDDLRQVVTGLAERALLTVFADCCHSGSVMRAFVDLSEVADSPGRSEVRTDVRRRYLPMTPGLESAFRAARGSQSGEGVGAASGARPAVTFSACRDWQVAYEHDGQGDFTRHCMTVLSADVTGLSNAGFLERVIAEFGEGSQQDPELDLADRFGSQPFLEVPGPAGGDRAPEGGGSQASVGPSADERLSGAARILRGLT